MTDTGVVRNIDSHVRHADLPYPVVVARPGSMGGTSRCGRSISGQSTRLPATVGWELSVDRWPAGLSAIGARFRFAGDGGVHVQTGTGGPVDRSDFSFGGFGFSKASRQTVALARSWIDHGLACLPVGVSDRRLCGGAHHCVVSLGHAGRCKRYVPVAHQPTHVSRSPLSADPRLRLGGMTA